MTNKDQSQLLGQFVALGQLVFQESDGLHISEEYYTQEHLNTFLNNVDRFLPLYLETLDQLRNACKKQELIPLLTELDKLYTLISYQSFKNFVVNSDSFLEGYQSKLGMYQH